MATPEVLVKKKIRKILDEVGVYYAMPIGTGYGNSGVPDFLVCAGGKFVGIEAKAGKGKTTALQESHLSRIRSAGGTAVVINEDNLHTLKELISCTTIIQ
jgi:pantoate kinase